MQHTTAHKNLSTVSDARFCILLSSLTLFHSLGREQLDVWEGGKQLPVPLHPPAGSRDWATGRTQLPV